MELGAAISKHADTQQLACLERGDPLMTDQRRASGLQQSNVEFISGLIRQ